MYFVGLGLVALEAGLGAGPREVVMTFATGQISAGTVLVNAVAACLRSSGVDEWIGVIAVVATARCILVPVAIGVGAWWRFTLEVAAGAILVYAVSTGFRCSRMNQRIVVIAIVAAALAVREAVTIRVRARRRSGRHIDRDFLFRFVALRVFDLDLDLP
jgi:hypothetical protein